MPDFVSGLFFFSLEVFSLYTCSRQISFVVDLGHCWCWAHDEPFGDWSLWAEESFIYYFWSFPSHCYLCASRYCSVTESFPDSLQPQGLQHARLLCPLPSPGAFSNSCPLSQWCYLNISSSTTPFSFCLQSFPISKSFSMSLLFTPDSQGASASVLPVNIQGWFPLGLISLISLQSKGLSRVLSRTTIWKHQFLGTQPSHGPTLTFLHHYGKSRSFDYMDLCQQSGVSAF